MIDSTRFLPDAPGRGIFTSRPSSPRDPSFTVTIRAGVVRVIDLDDGHCSVTNAAERVVGSVLRLLPQSRALPIIYRDSGGSWDQLLHDGARFVDFGMLHEPEEELAARRASRP